MYFYYIKYSEALVKTYTVELEEDPDSGELLMQIPTDILSQMGWVVGTELFWIVENGNIILKGNDDAISSGE